MVLTDLATNFRHTSVKPFRIFAGRGPLLRYTSPAPWSWHASTRMISPLEPQFRPSKGDRSHAIVPMSVQEVFR